MEISEAQLAKAIAETISKMQKKDINSPNFDTTHLVWNQRKDLDRKLDELYEECGLSVPMDSLVFYPRYPEDLVGKLVKTAYNADKWADIPVEYRQEAQGLYSTVASLLLNILSRSLRDQFLDEEVK